MMEAFGSVILEAIDNESGEVVWKKESSNNAVWLNKALMWYLFEGTAVDYVFNKIFEYNYDSGESDYTTLFNSAQNEVYFGTDLVSDINCFGRYSSTDGWITFWAGARKFSHRRGFITAKGYDYRTKDLLQVVGGSTNGKIKLVDKSSMGASSVFTYGGVQYDASGSGLSIYAFSGIEGQPGDPSHTNIMVYSGSDVINPYPLSVSDGSSSINNQYALGWEPVAVYTAPSVVVSDEDGDGYNDTITATVTYIAKLTIVGSRQVASSGLDTQPIWKSGQVYLYKLVLAPTVWLDVSEVISAPSSIVPSGSYSVQYITYGEKVMGFGKPIFPVKLAEYNVMTNISFDAVSVYIRWKIGFKYSYSP